MQRVILILLIVLGDQCLSEQPLDPLVVTNSGKIRGHYLTSYKGNKYEAYQGIPYAEPPVGEKRFRSPTPVKKWSNELPATELKMNCLGDFPPQLNKPVIGSEDCLYLNVCVPKKKTNASLPVFFYFPGLGDGTSSDQQTYIIDYDVIFVDANFRVGPLGFLSTEDDVTAGNMGLKDQSTALRWIHDNIEHFGGDPQKITLLGASAGGISVHNHHLSPWSRGLFHAGISLSGSVYIPGAIGVRSRENAIAFARALNCTDDDLRDMVKCLRNISVDVPLVELQDKLEAWRNMSMIFGPVIEKSSSDPFIDDHPTRILSEGRAYDVPWVTGIVSEEGLGETAAWVKGDTLKKVDENWNSLAPVVLHYLYTIPKEQHTSVARKIRKHYLGEKPINNKNLRQLTNLITDRRFGVSALKAVKNQATYNKSPVFFYYYSYKAVDSISNVGSNSTKDLGVAHGDDVHLVIKDPRISPTKSPNDMAVQRLLIEIWTSVAYNGVPNIGVKWPRVVPDNTMTLVYMHIAGPNDLIAVRNNNSAENKFWNSIGFDEN